MRFLIARDYNTADCYRYRVRGRSTSRAITIGDNTAISERTIDHCFIGYERQVLCSRRRES